MILISACLLGVSCRYDGASEGMHPTIRELVGSGEKILFVCPEQMGGLSTPRESADFTQPNLLGEAVLKGKSSIKTKSGADVTEQFVKGASEVARLARIFNVKKAILRRRSPSCGFGETYCRGVLVKGNGVMAAKLNEMGIEIEAIGGQKQAP